METPPTPPPLTVILQVPPKGPAKGDRLALGAASIALLSQLLEVVGRMIS